MCVQPSSRLHYCQAGITTAPDHEGGTGSGGALCLRLPVLQLECKHRSYQRLGAVTGQTQEEVLQMRFTPDGHELQTEERKTGTRLL